MNATFDDVSVAVMAAGERGATMNDVVRAINHVKLPVAGEIPAAPLLPVPDVDGKAYSQQAVVGIMAREAGRIIEHFTELKPLFFDMDYIGRIKDSVRRAEYYASEAMTIGHHERERAGISLREIQELMECVDKFYRVAIAFAQDFGLEDPELAKVVAFGEHRLLEFRLHRALHSHSTSSQLQFDFYKPGQF